MFSRVNVILKPKKYSVSLNSLFTIDGNNLDGVLHCFLELPLTENTPKLSTTFKYIYCASSMELTLSWGGGLFTK